MPRHYRKIKNKVINTTGNILSAPSRVRSAVRSSRADSDRKAIRLARAYDNAPSFSGGRITNAGKARSVARGVRARRMRQARKK